MIKVSLPPSSTSTETPGLQSKVSASALGTVIDTLLDRRLTFRTSGITRTRKCYPPEPQSAPGRPESKVSAHVRGAKLSYGPNV